MNVVPILSKRAILAPSCLWHAYCMMMGETKAERLGRREAKTINNWDFNHPSSFEAAVGAGICKKPVRRRAERRPKQTINNEQTEIPTDSKDEERTRKTNWR